MPDAPEPTDAEPALVQTCRWRYETPEQLFSLVHQELRQVARAYMRRERADQTLEATALVNEANVRLFYGRPFQRENRKHLFCTVVRSMRCVLVDHTRNKGAGGAVKKVSIEEQVPAIFQDLPRLLALDQALERLAKLSPIQAQVTDLHSFAGLTEEEAAEVLDVSSKTVKNDWRFAKAWLKTEMDGEAG